MFTACLDSPGEPFRRDDLATVVIEDLGEAAEHYGCNVSIYCLMPDHLHVILTGPSEESDTLAAMMRFKQRNSFHMKRIDSGVDWQKDFHDHVVRPTESLSHHVLYAAGNPVRAGLVEHWEDYRWTGSIGCSLDEVVVSAAYLQDASKWLAG